jgi:membrane dipeptidase
VTKQVEGRTPPPGEAERDELRKAYAAKHPPVFATVEQVADHIEHITRLAGVDHVGFGSDFDGVGDSLPTGLKDVSQYPNLVKVLLERGWSEADIEKVCGGNLLRVWRAVEQHARASTRGN